LRVISDISSEGRRNQAASEMEIQDMKKMIVLALAALAAISSGKFASAQGHQVQGQIPFDFNVGSARLSAGEYRISYDISGLVAFRNLENSKTVAILAGPDQPANDGRCKLVFARYGDRYFLRQSACGSANVNFFVPSSASERLAQEQASSTPDGTRVMLAMK
jgi:hypothetical protein